jgi:hypothetical protein
MEKIEQCNQERDIPVKAYSTKNRKNPSGEDETLLMRGISIGLGGSLAFKVETPPIVPSPFTPLLPDRLPGQEF